MQLRPNFSNLLVANGAFEALFSMGFEEDTDALFLPFSASIEVVKAFKSAIEKLTPPPEKTLEKTTNETQSQATPSVSQPSKKDIICSGDVCMDITKERPLMGFIKFDHRPIPTANPISRNVSVFNFTPA